MYIDNKILLFISIFKIQFEFSRRHNIFQSCGEKKRYLRGTFLQLVLNMMNHDTNGKNIVIH